MLSAVLAWVLAAQPAPAPAALSSDAQQEAFLSEARVVKTRAAGGGGITGAERATLELDGLRHDALIQTIDEQRSFINLPRGPEMDFRDSYRNNVAAYRLDRMLGIGMVPVTVERTWRRKHGGFSWWVDDVMMDERKRLGKKIEVPDSLAWNRQMWVVRVFDQLIFNTDRNLGNLLIDKSWRMWMIDHTRAFKIFTEVKNPRELSTHCERHLLEALRRLDHDSLAETMRDLLSESQIKGLLARRDQIVAYYEEQIRTLGEDQVLYDLPGRTSAPPPPGP